MCGISGVFGARREDLIRRMLGRIAHRGPDDEYYVLRDGATLGARRLSIIDLESGRQPLGNEEGTVFVAQNGEIYNFPELKEKLLARGHRFRTRSDTEVLVHLYEEKGLKFVDDLQGMFAIALWDEREKKGMLVRDRPGKKPLYYLHLGNALYFASEIKCLLEVPEYRRELEYRALHHYLGYKHTPCPLTIFRNIFMLPPAHYLVFHGEENRIALERYWEIDFQYLPGADDMPEEALAGELIKVLEKAVKRRLISDVPIGFFLSGGLDSSLSTAIAATESPGRIKTFTLTYPEGKANTGKFEDQLFARRISEQYGTEHHEECIDMSDFCEEFPRIISHFDEPFAGVVSTYFLARLIAKHVKVALSGDGADELFGSYLSHRLAYPLHNLGLWGKTGEERFRDFTPFENQMPYLESLYEPEEWRWRAKLLVFSDEEKERLYSGAVNRRFMGAPTSEHLRNYFSSLGSKDPLNRILEAEFYSFLPDQVLAFVDRLSMAHSLEVRTAYLDHEFISLAFCISGMLKRKSGEVKYILKKAALKYLPADLVFRKKEGFVLPINLWLLEDMESYVKDILSAKRLALHGLFDGAYVKGLIEEFYHGKRDLANKVLTLLAFQVWYEGYMEGPH
ncbi:MAG: asparagine synthase (glutamine-hydrolyzing) [Candidatus Eremiobacteraeota bacterium]|nr:asparagine synthase (glutamine-hydrolyzing) [Candidatus Eremiobacteraeota bacterium]